jgi:predicted nuclease with TOPRIM domain
MLEASLDTRASETFFTAFWTEIERLKEELSNKNKEASSDRENLRGINQLLSRENHQLSVKNEKLSHENHQLTLKLKEKMAEVAAAKRGSIVLSGHTQGVSGEMITMRTCKILFVHRLLDWYNCRS